MNFIQKAALKLLGAKITNQIYAQTVNSGVVTWSGQKKYTQVNEGYRMNDIVYSCINLISEKAKVAPWQEYEIVDKVTYKLYAAKMAKPELIDDWNEMAAMQRKALQPVKSPTKISELLEYPNDTECWSELIKAAVSYKLITGDTFISGSIIEAGANKGAPNSLNVLPSHYMSIIADITQYIPKVTGYQLQVNTITQFTPDEILHDKSFNPNWDGIGSQLYGMSPLEAGARVLTRSNEGKNYAVATLQNGGPQGVMMVKNADFGQSDLAAQVDLVKARLIEPFVNVDLTAKS